MKKNNMYNNNLYTFFCTDNTNNIKKVLECFNEIDILYENGIFLEFAISKGNVDICSALLNYFEDKQFSIKSRDYEEAKDKLIEILENITSDMQLASEMKQVLSPYIDFEDSVDSRDHDFDEFNLNFPISYENDRDYEITTSGNIIEHDHNTETLS